MPETTTTAAPETATNGATPPAEAPAWVDERIKKLSAQRGEALDRITELEKELEGLRPLADSGAAWKTKAEELEEKLSGAEGKWGTERALLEAGVKDAELRELFAWQYERTPADGRPPFGEWLSGLTPETAPAALKAYLPGQAPKAEAPKAEAKEASPPPPADRGTKKAPPAARDLSADEIRGASAESWSQVRERLKAEYSNRRR